MIADGTIVARPGDDDPGAIALMHKLSKKSRERWPGVAVDFPAATRPAADEHDARPSAAGPAVDELESTLELAATSSSAR